MTKAMKTTLIIVLTVILLFVLIIATAPLWLQVVSYYPSPYLTVDSYEDACEKLKHTDDFVPYFADSQFQSPTYELRMSGRSIFAKAEYLNAVLIDAYVEDSRIQFIISVEDSEEAWQVPNLEYNGIGYFTYSYGNKDTMLKLGDKCYKISYSKSEPASAILELKETLVHELIDQYVLL